MLSPVTNAYSPSRSNGYSSNLSSSELTDRYEVTGVVLGVGKHSSVVQVRNKQSGQNYACKILSRRDGNEGKIEREINAMSKFKNEFSSQMLENLKCSKQLPNVTSLPPYSCIVMTQIDGEPLTALLFRAGGNPSMAWKLLSQIAAVLRDLHSQQLVHRDIWSENIMVGSDGNFYLIDYGCAESALNPSPLALKEGLNIPYVSPQMCKKQPPAGGDDMWALGLVLTELVTGQHIIRRMGGNENPIFTQKECFQRAIDETVAMGGPLMGEIVKRLLAEREHERATANDVLAMIAGQQTQINTTPAYVSTPRSGVQSQPAFYAGQKILYQAKSHIGKHQATIIGRGPTNTSWMIQLQGGPKEVLDADSWRLTPDGQMVGKVVQDKSLSDAVTISVAPELQPGKVVLYQASTHNASYKGVLMGRSPDLAGWVLQLEVHNSVTIKVVPDSEAWRLKPAFA